MKLAELLSDQAGVPDFRLKVQEILDDGAVRVIVHGSGHSTETLAYVVVGNSLMAPEAYDRRRRLLPKT